VELASLQLAGFFLRFAMKASRWSDYARRAEEFG